MSAFLSVRLPEAVRDRLNAVAATRGESVQGLVGHLVERFLLEEDPAPPELSAVLRKLREHASALESWGVTGLWVFGSVARGDAQVGSDVDLFADFDTSTHLCPIRLASLRAELSDVLGAPADVVERGTLNPAVRREAERDAVWAV